MNKVDRLLKKLDKARSETLAKPPVRLATKYKHYKTTKTKAEQAIQNIERINRNAKVIIIKKGKV